MAKVNLAHVAEIYEALGTGRARHMGNKGNLLGCPGTIAIDDRVLLRMETAAITWLVSVAAIW